MVRSDQQKTIGRAKQVILQEVLNKHKPEVIVEIGTMRHTELTEDGLSTPVFVEYALAHNASFTSVDLNPEATSLAHSLFGGLEGIRILNEDGEAFLKSFGSMDFLYLDSSNDPQDTYRQAMAAKHPKVIVIDDCHSYNNQMPIGKGTLAIPFLLGLGYSLELVDLPYGPKMAVLER